MSTFHSDDDLLHEYEVDPSADDGSERRGRLQELREAIENGRYDVEGEFSRLMGRIGHMMGGGPE